MNERELKKLVFQTCREFPFFTSWVIGVKNVLDLNVQTACTDGTTTRFNPEFMDSLTPPEQKFVVLHEAGHCFLAHHLRMRPSYNPQLANMAMDYVINDMLRVFPGIHMPKGGLWDPKYKWTETDWETIYRSLPQGQQYQQGQQGQDQGQQGQDQGQQGQGQGQQGQDQGQQGQDQGQQGQGQGQQGQGQQGQDQGQQGQGQQGQGQQPHLVPASSLGEIIPAQMTETERQSALAEHACRQQASIQEGLRAGTIPGDLARVLENLDPRDKAGWREILQLKFTHKVAQGRDWMRPNRRHFARGLYLPSKRSAGYCVPCVAIDTSGSISQSNIDELISELLSMVEVINDLGGEDPEFQVAHCDSHIHGIEVVSDVHTIKPKGGGGTDFAPIMGAVLDGRLKGDFLVYLTDGECDSFGEDPGIPVVWVITTGGSRRFNPPFGEVTFLED